MLPKMAPDNGVDVKCTMLSRSTAVGPSIVGDIGIGIALMMLLDAEPIALTSRPAQDPLPAAAAMVAPVAGKPSLKAVARHR